MTPGIAPDKIAAEGGSFQDAVRSMFNDIAPSYDAFKGVVAEVNAGTVDCAALKVDTSPS